MSHFNLNPVEVLDAYKKLKEEGKLAPNLNDPTPGSLRNEFLIVEASKSREQRLYEHFKGSNNQKKLDIDKFKPVVNYLNGETARPNIYVVALVAWMLPEEETQKVPIEIPGQNGIGGQGHQDPLEPAKKWLGLTIGIVLLVLVLGIAFFPRYMVWKETHYEFSFSSEDENNNLLQAADWGLIWNFKKITRRDTLNEYSIGKVWYLKEQNDYDVFTRKGNHPVFVTRALRPMTQRILDSIKVRVKEEKIARSFKAE